jgi:hypothetical protein
MYASVSRMTGIPTINHKPPVRPRYAISDGPQLPTPFVGSAGKKIKYAYIRFSAIPAKEQHEHLHGWKE